MRNSCMYTKYTYICILRGPGKNGKKKSKFKYGK